MRLRAISYQGDCSGDLTAAAIVDHVVIPAGLTPGDYILGFRWDCEGEGHACATVLCLVYGGHGAESFVRTYQKPLKSGVAALM